MHRRNFLKSGAALPIAAIPGLSRFAYADSIGAPWRVFEVTTQVEILEPAGVTRAWLPVPLTADTDYFKNLGNDWNAEAGAARYVQEPKYNAGIVAAEFKEGV
ncbi:MAG TPA: transglutaminase, partial [Burkholderiales bacterium]